MHPRYPGLGCLIRGICHYTLIHSFHITYRYIDPFRHNFENCLIHDLSLRAAWASLWLYDRLKEPWETNKFSMIQCIHM